MVYWDRETKRFGVRHTPSGCLSFIIQFRNRQGKSRRLTIGEYGSWTPALAREEAKRLLRIVDEGGDPAQTRLEDREAIAFEQLVAEYMAKAEAGQLPRQTQKKAGTLLVDRYRVQHLVRYFGSRAVKDITRLDCQRCLAKLVAGNHGAARTMGLLGGILSYAVNLIGLPNACEQCPDLECCNVEPIVLSASLIVGADRFNLTLDRRDDLSFAIEVAPAAAPGKISATNATPAVSESLKSIATSIIKAESVRIGAGGAVVDLAISRHLWIRSTIGGALACTRTRGRGVAALVLPVAGA